MPAVAVPDATVVGWAVVVAVATWHHDARGIFVLGGAACWLLVVVACAGRRGSGRDVVAMVVAVTVAAVLAVVAGTRADAAWDALAPDRLGAYTGWVRLVDDPAPTRSSTRVIVDVEGERYEMWVRGRAAQQRVTTWRGGDWVTVSGTLERLDAQRARRVAWQHVVGELSPEWLGDVAPGGPVARAANSVRATIERAATAIPEPHGALYRGLVIGDDREQPFDMIQRFRASGLSHLTAVSGQNVAFLVAACGPLLVRLRPWTRWACTLALIAWFVTLTRFEPSILRAGVMAGLTATAYLRGAERSTIRVLALAVIGLVLVDPLLVWAIGFWLSVGATAGVCTVGPWLAGRLHRLGPLAVPLGVTLGAQAGIVVPSVLVFGRLPLVSVPANLLAVPVAGMVMLYGLPAGIVAGQFAASAPVLAAVVMAPATVGTRWVDLVATLAARLEPAPPVSVLGWVVVAAVVVVVVRRAR